MNERIRELAEQAGLKTELWNNPEPFTIYKEDANNPGGLEKFAELIVRECADLCLNNETFQGMFNTMEYRKGRHFNSIIKEHFGVEE